MVRSKIAWDTKPPRDLQENELALLYEIDGATLRMVSLDRPRLIVLSLRDGQPRRLFNWLEIIT